MLVAVPGVRLGEPVGVVALGDPDGERLHVQIEHRIEPAEDREWDGSWAARVTVSAGPWSGTTVAPLRAEELFDFGRQLTQLSDAQEGFAVLRTRGDGLFVRVSVDGRGGVFVQGHVTDCASPRADNALVFALPRLSLRQLKLATEQVRTAELELGVRAGLDGAVEVRSRYDGTWVPGFEIAEILHLDDDPLVRLRRSSDGTVLPRLFGAEEIRPHEIRPTR
jgi:hypothetical protein